MINRTWKVKETSRLTEVSGVGTWAWVDDDASHSLKWGT